MSLVICWVSGLDLGGLLSRVEGFREAMVSTLVDLISIPAIGPENGGDGEWAKARRIQEVLEGFGFRVERYDSPDPRVPSGYRPNIVVRLPGEGDRTLWIITHMDVVPPGDLSSWKYPPFKPVVEGGKVYGRGAEDNGQSLVASIYALRAIREFGVKPGINVALAIVSDEETGNKHGINYLISRGLFRHDDLILVPDAGNSDGSMVEVAEKHIMWVRLDVEGKQCHASMPHRCLNASRVAADLILTLDRYLHEKYSFRDPLFDPPNSTFEPTKREPNVESVNILPGRDVSYFDCRVLPRYSLDEVEEDFRRVASQVASRYGAKVSVEVVAKIVSPPPTDVNSEIVRRLIKTIRLVRGVEARPMGIGGGTCAAPFRARGYQVAVWMTSDETAHKPNEYSKISNLVGDAKVFAALPFIEG